MNATVTDNLWIYFSNLSTHEEDILHKEFSVSRPGRYFHQGSDSAWDGVYYRYNKSKHRLARPYLAMLRLVCAKHNLALVVQDTRKQWQYKVWQPEEITPTLLPGITLDQFQIEALQKIAATECGLISLPTGGGKGELICGACRIIECPTTIITDQTVVVDQLRDRLAIRDFKQVGVFYAGRRPNGEPITVGLIQSLTIPSEPKTPYREGHETDEDFAKKLIRFGTTMKGYNTRLANTRQLHAQIKASEMIIVDEADRASGPAWKYVFRHVFKGRRRYGFSGTMFDPDKEVQNLFIQEHLGSVIYHKDRRDMVGLGRIVDDCSCTIVGCEVNGDIHESSTFDIAYDQWLIKNTKFHQLVAGICKKRTVDKNGTLVLVERRELGDNLAAAIKALGLSVEFVHGDWRPKLRKAAFQSFERRELQVLIGGKIINRGLDLCGGCENIIIIGSSKLSSELLQKIGRALRRNRQNKSRMYGFMFRCNRYLYSHSKSLIKTLVKANYPVEIVLPGGKLAGADLIKSNFRINKKLLSPQM